MRRLLPWVVLIGIAGIGPGLRAQTPVVVPLVNFSNSGQLGINVLIGTDPTPHTYLLDTGSAAFATAMGTSSSWTNATFTPTGGTFDISYGDGSLEYTGNVATATVTLSDANGDALAPVTNATLGIITNQPYANWTNEINSTPPIAPESPTTHQFFGTFGAGLFETASGLSSVLGQMAPAGLTQGFIIDTGGIQSTTPTLTIGLTAAAIASFPIKIPMNSMTGQLLTSTGVTVNLYPEAQTNAKLSLINGGGNYTKTIDVIIDSGGLNTHYSTHDTLPASIASGMDITAGTDFSLTKTGLSGNEDLDWTFTTGTTDYVDKMTLMDGNDALNTGIALYYQYEVMFDTQDGIIGLDPIVVPEPSSCALVAGGVFFAFVAWRRGRSREA